MLCVCPASISSFLTVLAWYPNTSLRTWCLVLHSLTLMTNMPACGQYSTLTGFLMCVMKELSHYVHSDWLITVDIFQSRGRYRLEGYKEILKMYF